MRLALPCRWDLADFLLFFFFAASSHQGLTAAGLAINRFASNPSFSKSEEIVDLEERGKELAARCYQEDEGFLAKDKIAEWLGGK